MNLLQTLKEKEIRSTERRAKRFTEHVLRSSCPDDDLCAHRRNPNLDAGVTVLGKLPRENLVQLSEENAISNELNKIRRHIEDGLIINSSIGFENRGKKKKKKRSNLSLFAHLSRHISGCRSSEIEISRRLLWILKALAREDLGLEPSRERGIYKVSSPPRVCFLKRVLIRQ